jgi:putative ABC transport system permease protein
MRWSVWRQLTRGLRGLFHRRAADQDVADEVQDYLDQAIAEHRARGLSPDDALRAARLELGNVTTVREQVRGVGWENALEVLFADLRYAARRLRRTPGFTVVAVLTIAIGIGATTAIFGAINPILIEDLPYHEPGRIMAVLEVTSGGGRNGGTFGMYRAFVDRTHSFAAIAVLKPWQPALTGLAEPEVIRAQRVSASYFRVLGVLPAQGRDFTTADDRLRGPNVVIISDALWRRHFGADRAIIGRPVMLDDDAFEVIGVLPRGFEDVLAPSAEAWAPLQYDLSQGQAWGHHLRTIARLSPGVGLEQATGDVAAVGKAVLTEQHPETYDPNTQFAVTSLHQELTGGVRQALVTILGAVILVLAIACVNVTNLLLARGVQRRGEIALRAALGAGQGRLMRQLLTESLLLAALGGAAGMVVALLGVRALVALSPSELPRLGAIGLHGSVFVFGLGITTLIGLVMGMAPALQAARTNPQGDLQHASRRSTGGHRRTRGALVTVEVALALVLLVGSGLLLRSLERLFAVRAGFDTGGLLTMQVQTPSHRFDQDSFTNRFFERVLEAVRQVPGVTAAGLTSQLPLSTDDDEYGAQFEARSSQGDATYPVYRYAVSPGYVETMGIPLREGRALDSRDVAGAPLVAVISQSLATSRLAAGDPIGQRLRIGPGGPFTVVGVVGNVRQVSLARNETDAVYTPERQWPYVDRSMSLVVRSRGNPAALAVAVRRAIWSVDRDQPIVRVASMPQLMAARAAERRFALTLFAAFGVAALVLASAGIYGVLAGSVAERTREIGVRAALGASRARIVGLVVRQGMLLTGLGVALGLIGAAAATQAIATLLFGVSPLDPITYAGVTALLVGVALVACGVPAWRAAQIDPAQTLRTE